MDTSEIISIIKRSEKSEKFFDQFSEYDIVIRDVSIEDQDRIQNQYPELNLFPKPQEDVIAVTLISRILMQNGYPKVKAYIDMKKKRYRHVFVSL